MSKNIHILFNANEITAGTRGASLGPGAIVTAARKMNDGFFGEYPQHWLPDFNHLLNQPPVYQFAKNIDGLMDVVRCLKSDLKKTIEKGNFPIVIAGDHGSAAGTIIGLKQHYTEQKLGVIWIDAHGDLHTPYTTPSGNMHGMPLAIAMGADNLDCKRNDISPELFEKWEQLKTEAGGIALSPENLMFFGVRDTEPEEDFLIKKFGIRNVTVDQFRQDVRQTWQQELDAFISKIDVLYVSFDVDSMDPEITSYGTGTPVPNGFKPEEAQEMLTFLAQQKKLICMEFVEVNPCLDNKKNTMAEITFDLIKNTVQIIEKNK